MGLSMVRRSSAVKEGVLSLDCAQPRHGNAVKQPGRPREDIKVPVGDGIERAGVVCSGAWAFWVYATPA